MTPTAYQKGTRWWISYVGLRGTVVHVPTSCVSRAHAEEAAAKQAAIAERVRLGALLEVWR